MNLRRRLMTANEPDILWLYKEGDECIDVTGGWTVSGDVVKMDNRMGFSTINSGRRGKAILTNAVSFYNTHGKLKAKYLYIDCEFSVNVGNKTTFTMSDAKKGPIPFGLDKKIKPVNADDVIIYAIQRITLKYSLQELSALYPRILDLKEIYFDYAIQNKFIYNLYLGN